MIWLKRTLLAIIAIAALVLIAGYALQTHPRPQPETMPGHIRTEIAVPGRDRPVTLNIWYPAADDGEAGLLGQNALFYGAWVREGATPLPGKRPVLLLSHGSGGNAARLSWLAAPLASQGMIVIGPDHPGTTSGDSDPFQTVKIWERPEDLSAALDLILTAPPAGLTADPDRVGALGFSLGGASALALTGMRYSKGGFIDYCAANAGELDCGWMTEAGVDFTTIDQTRYEADLSDPRVGTAIAVDPALSPAAQSDAITGFSRPALIVNLGAEETLPAGLQSAPLAKAMPGAEYHAVPGAKHFSFLPECSTLGKIVIGLAGEDSICSDSGLRPRPEVQAEILALVSGFLARQFGPME